MQLSEHFTVAEFIASETADRHGIDNDLPLALYPTARETCAMLERIRTHLGRIKMRTVPISITSGYRCQALNRKIGSSDTSDHVKGMAADIKAWIFGSPIEIARALEPHVDSLGIGQLIAEFTASPTGGWVHVSTRTPANPANRLLTSNSTGARTGIHAG